MCKVVLLAVILALPASAQSINIDLGPADSPIRTPPPGYGGSAQAPGVWNAVSTLQAANLVKWDGSPTAVTFSITNSDPGCSPTSPFFAGTYGATSGADESLLDDGLVDDDFTWDCTFTGLESGDYTVDTIMVGFLGCLPPARILVSVAGSPDPAQYVGGSWSGAYVQGDDQDGSSANFSRHTVTVTNGTLQIHAAHASTFGDWIRVCGFQLDKHDQAFLGEFKCYGDGTAGACPCGNSGNPGFGCQNSAGTGGAFLYASGTTNPDTVVLRCSGERPTALSIFLQGNAILTPHIYGDGLRCTGGTLKRLYSKSAVGGLVAAPQAGDPSITARSAALGDPIAPGERRYYQVYSRDPDPGFCAPPTGGTFNVSSAIKIVW